MAFSADAFFYNFFRTCFILRGSAITSPLMLLCSNKRFFLSAVGIRSGSFFFIQNTDRFSMRRALLHCIRIGHLRPVCAPPFLIFIFRGLKGPNIQSITGSIQGNIFPSQRYNKNITHQSSAKVCNFASRIFRSYAEKAGQNHKYRYVF